MQKETIKIANIIGILIVCGLYTYGIFFVEPVIFGAFAGLGSLHLSQEKY